MIKNQLKKQYENEADTIITFLGRIDSDLSVIKYVRGVDACEAFQSTVTLRWSDVLELYRFLGYIIQEEGDK